MTEAAILGNEIDHQAQSKGVRGSLLAPSDAGVDCGCATSTSPPKAVLDAMASTLDAHPDYRVLRRLIPRRDFGVASQGKTGVVVILDVETTGLDPRQDKIIELAMIRVEVELESGRAIRVLDEYEGFDDPGVQIDAQITRLTGIRDAMVRGKRLDEERIARVLDGSHLVVAHNAKFDRAFVEARLPIFSEASWACSCTEIDWAAEDFSSAKLSSIAMSYGWFFDGHRALMDCHAVLAVIDHVLPVSPGTGLGRLLDAASERSYRVRATAAPFEVKDTLKARGYRWDSEVRVWHTMVRGEAALLTEREWLKRSVYGGKGATIAVEEFDAKVRFSGRAGRRDAVRL